MKTAEELTETDVVYILPRIKGGAEEVLLRAIRMPGDGAWGVELVGYDRNHNEIPKVKPWMLMALKAMHYFLGESFDKLKGEIAMAVVEESVNELRALDVDADAGDTLH